MKGLGLGGLLAVVALVGCGSSGSSTGTGGNTGTGATGHAGSTGTAGNGSAGHAGGGGGTTGSGAPFSTSVPSGTKLTGLTGAQQTQLCSDLENFVDHTFFPELCVAAASGSLDGLTAAYFDLIENPSATDTELRSTCTAAAADAGANASMCANSTLDAGTQSCDVSSIPAACQATVGEYTTCLNAETTAGVQFYAGLPACSTITAASISGLFAADGGLGLGLNGGVPIPASCAVFEAGGACDAEEAGTNDSPKMPLRSAALARAFRKK